MKHKIRHFILLITLGLASIVSAQEDCPVLVQTILETVDTACEGIGRNQVCYGNNLVNALSLDGDSLDDFMATGDIVDISKLEVLETTPFDAVTGTWGIAIMQLQADLPDSLPGQNVTFVVYGDTEIVNDTPDDASSIQAFSMSTGIGQPACDEVPPDGVLVQAPQDTTVHFLVNGIEVEVGSTGFLQVSDDTLVVNTFDGTIRLGTDEVSQLIEPGFQSIVDSDGTPSEPEAYDYETVRHIPAHLLPDAVTIPITVDSNSDWMDTGIVITPGTEFTLTASGTVNFWENCEAETVEFNMPDFDCSSIILGPGGGLASTLDGTVLSPDSSVYLVPDAPLHSLVGRIGDTTFFVGENLSYIAETGGRLELRVNDSDYNNSGAFVVTVEIHNEE